MKNGNILGSDYISFGNGKKKLIILPGLGDGLRTVKGTALPMSWIYRRFAKEYTVYMFSRKNDLPDGISTRDMAADQIAAMDALHIDCADVLGVSMGGMIAQWMAIDHPRRIGKLVLVVTASRSASATKSLIQQWIEYAQCGDSVGFMDSNVKAIYSDEYYKKNRWMIPVTARLTKPKSYDRFYRQAEACIKHDAQEYLAHITSPTLILAGGKDEVIDAESTRAMTNAIANVQSYTYPELGHGLYEEAPDFQDRILRFLCED